MGTHRKTFTMALMNIKQEAHFRDFSEFIMEKMGMLPEGEITETMRREAYKDSGSRRERKPLQRFRRSASGLESAAVLFRTGNRFTGSVWRWD